ncbi:MAG: short-chain dehydrogenase [Marinilabiliales bacterium]|nr:MAG: short-chain dehydrogenase [Marinilabiliales bacterium]
MRRTFYITGTSRGIGLALANELLEDSNNYVLGISRNNVISHERYQHVQLDLTDLDSVEKFRFTNPEDQSEIYLVNNAGLLGDIQYFGKRKSHDIRNTLLVNFVSPAMLSNTFIQQFGDVKTTKVILNISSGASKNAIDGWVTYCSSKAGIEMMSKTIDVEQKQSDPSKKTKILSVAPGIIETAMQEQIRMSDEEDFSRVTEFIQLKNNGLLDTPESVAKKLRYILLNAQQYNNVDLDIRNLSFQ